VKAETGKEKNWKHGAVKTGSWMDIVRRDLKDMDTTWDEAEELATDGAVWR